MSKQATLADVAALANVSVITASRAMRGQSHVAAATREKVLAAATELGYSPDVLARTMRGASSKLIGVFLIGFGSMVLHELLVGVEEQAHRHGYDLVVTNVAIYDNGRTAGADMLLKLCEGVIWLLPSADNSLMAKLETGAVPAVLVNYVARNAPLPVVSGDNYASARALTEHLLALQHRKIAFVEGAAHSGQSGERRRGYEDALRAAGIALRDEYIVEGDHLVSGGHRAGRTLIGLKDRPTAIFCANDNMAMGAMQAATEAGLEVPKDMSIAGFDDIPAAAVVSPTLTTVRQPLHDLGTRAVDELMAIIAGRTSQAIRIELPSQVIVRESTAAPSDFG